MKKLSNYWGKQTQAALKHFAVGQEKFPKTFIKTLAMIKKSAALANGDLKVLSKDKSRWIAKVSDEVIAGQLDECFPLTIWHSGSGTQTNMNLNEVIANRANHLSRQKNFIHPNDDVNRCQSTNDVFPTAMHMIVYEDIIKKLLPSLKILRNTLAKKQRAFRAIKKVGRTHLQDAVTITFGQEFSGYVTQLDNNFARIKKILPDLLKLPMGGTAVGTGINAHTKFASKTIKYLRKLTKHPFKLAQNRFSLMAAHDELVFLSGALKTLACSLYKIANDIRYLSSGPNAGLNELILPANEAGSSIMPGKVNPTQCEMILMVCMQAMGNDTTITFANSQGNLELNVFKPVIIFNLLQSIQLLSEAMQSFSKFCVVGLKINKLQVQKNLENNLMNATLLTPHIGYQKATQVVQYAIKHRCSVKQACLKLKFLTEKQLNII